MSERKVNATRSEILVAMARVSDGSESFKYVPELCDEIERLEAALAVAIECLSDIAEHATRGSAMKRKASWSLAKIREMRGE